MIVQREFSAGQQLHQEQLAARLNVSRIPVREALKALEAERLLAHEPNRGYFVVSLNAEELRQLYIMRRVLEKELLRTTVRPDAAWLKNIRALHRELADAAAKGAVNRVATLNRQFHFEVFALSPLTEIFREVERLWRISEQYRALYLSVDITRQRVVDDHALMIAALRNGKAAQLIKVADQHRSAAERRLIGLLSQH